MCVCVQRSHSFEVGRGKKVTKKGEEDEGDKEKEEEKNRAGYEISSHMILKKQETISCFS